MIYCLLPAYRQAGENVHSAKNMGVIHKLKQEVISSIIQQKREDPSLSCRQLAQLISQRYQIKVSKSSINAILKNAALSSTVGRRPSYEGRKKFQIPSQKKKQLLESMPASIPEAVVGRDRSRPVPTMIPPEGLEKKVVSEEPLPPAPPPPPSFKKERLLEEIQASRAQRAAPAGRRYEGLGYIFLKAAEWEISKTSILGGLLRKYMKEPLPANFNEICEGWLFFEHIQQYREHGLWVLNGLDDKTSAQTLLNWGRAIEAALPAAQTAHRATLRYFHEKQQNFLEVSGMKLFLEDGTALVTDAQMTTFWEERIPAAVSAVLHKAVRYLSQSLIANNQSAVFYMTPVYHWISSFASLPGKRITKIVLMGPEGDEMACFPTIPFKKRFFVTGVWPWQKEFSFFAKDRSKAQSQLFYHQVTDRALYYLDTVQELSSSADFFDPSLKAVMPCLRVILLWEEESDDPLTALLTNQMQTEAQEILAAYVERWPNLNQSRLFSWLKERNFVESPVGVGMEKLNNTEAIGVGPWSFARMSLDASEIFRDFWTAIHQYCQRHYFHRGAGDGSRTNVKSIYYDIPGYLDKQEGFLRIVLTPPSSYAYDQEIRYAVRCLNESCVIGPAAHRVWVEITR